MSVRKPTQVRAPPMAVAMAAPAPATAAPVSDMSRLSLVLGAGAKEAAAREAEATGAKEKKGIYKTKSGRVSNWDRLHKKLADDPELRERANDHAERNLPEGHDMERGAMLQRNIWKTQRAQADAEERAEYEQRMLAQKLVSEGGALGDRAMVQARLYTVAAKLNIAGLRQFTAILKMSPMWVNVLMMTEGRIEKKTGEYKQMMAENGFDLEAKLRSDEADDKYFQLVYMKMRLALTQAINRTNTGLVNDLEAYEKIQDASNRTAAKILSLAGTELQQPGKRLDQSDLNKQASDLEPQLLQLLKREFPPMQAATTTGAPVDDAPSELSLAEREVEATGVGEGKEVMRRVRKAIPGIPEGGIRKPSIKNLGKSRPRLFDDDDEEGSNDDKDNELKDLAAQKAPEALGPQEMVKARLFTVAAKFNIHALEEFVKLGKENDMNNLVYESKMQIMVKTNEYLKMMASNGFDLEAKLKSTDKSEAYFQEIFATMRDALQLSIRIHGMRMIGSQLAFSKLEKAAQLTAAFTIKFAGTELEQPGPKDAAEAKSVQDTADRLVVMNMDLFNQ